MKEFKKVFLLAFLVFIGIQAHGQRPRPGGDPSRMIQREKQLVLSEVSNLTDEQKETVNILYDALSLEMDQKMAEAEQEIRAERKAIRERVSTTLEGTLSAEQFKEYKQLMEDRKRHARNRGIK